MHAPEDEPQGQDQGQGQDAQPRRRLRRQLQRGTQDDAGHDIGRRPGEGGEDVGGQEALGVHAHHARHHRDHRPDRPDEAAEGHALAAVLFKEALPPGQAVRVAGEGPDEAQPLPVMMPKPIADAVPYDGPARGPGHHGPEAEHPGGNRRSGPNHHDGAGYEHADHRQGFGHGYQEDDQISPMGISRDPGQHLLNKFRHQQEPSMLDQPRPWCQPPGDPAVTMGLSWPRGFPEINWREPIRNFGAA